MQYTTNYNLITVEGTDVVNPLVQMNPNFTDIDAAMFANKQATIGTASEIVSGTVHAITRANTDSDYFKFTATGNWTSGDSMSVDGVTVSVFLTDGTTPGTGAYVINSEVFGMISGSRVTLFLASPEVQNIGDLNDLETSDKTNLVNAINEVRSDIYLTPGTYTLSFVFTGVGNGNGTQLSGLTGFRTAPGVTSISVTSFGSLGCFLYDGTAIVATDVSLTIIDGVVYAALTAGVGSRRLASGSATSVTIVVA